MVASLEVRVWENDFGAPSIDPNCVELLTLLKINKLNFETHYANVPQWMPIPSLKTDKKTVTGMEMLELEISKRCPRYVDKRLRADQVGRLKAYKEYFKEAFCPAFQFECWLNENNYEQCVKPWFSTVMSFPLSKVYLKMTKSTTEEQFANMLGTQNSDIVNTNLKERAGVCLEDFSRLLDDGRLYLLGTFPTSLDALVYANLVVAFNIPLPDSYIQSTLKSKTNLVRYIAHMTQKYFPDTPSKLKYLQPVTLTNEQASTGTVIFAGICVSTFMFLYGVSQGVIKLPSFLQN